MYTHSTTLSLNIWSPVLLWMTDNIWEVCCYHRKQCYYLPAPLSLFTLSPLVPVFPLSPCPAHKHIPLIDFPLTPSRHRVSAHPDTKGLINKARASLRLARSHQTWPDWLSPCPAVDCTRPYFFYLFVFHCIISPASLISSLLPSIFFSFVPLPFLIFPSLVFLFLCPVNIDLALSLRLHTVCRYNIWCAVLNELICFSQLQDKTCACVCVCVCVYLTVFGDMCWLVSNQVNSIVVIQPRITHYNASIGFTICTAQVVCPYSLDPSEENPHFNREKNGRNLRMSHRGGMEAPPPPPPPWTDRPALMLHVQTINSTEYKQCNDKISDTCEMKYCIFEEWRVVSF